MDYSFTLDETGKKVLLDGLIVAGLYKGEDGNHELIVSTHWLKKAGFEGQVKVHSLLSGPDIFQIDI